ncbi:MAG: glycosyltransferase family 2 protein [Chloroflexota bacterium]
MTAISVVMPCYNRAYDLCRVLDAYDRQQGKIPFEVIAIDDASNDGTFQLLAGYRPQNYRLSTLRQERNQGPAAARNRGIERVSAPLTVFVGDDILPGEDFLHRHLLAHQIHSARDAAILGLSLWPSDAPVNTLMEHIDGVGAQQFSYHFLKHGRVYDFRHFYTSNISLKTDFLKAEAKWFDTGFPYAAFEDVELSYRLSQRGLKIIYDQTPQAYHYHYHNIWSFSRRQRSAGQMIERLVHAHPGIRRLPAFRVVYQRVESIARRTSRSSSLPSPDNLARVELLACHLVSFYEWYEQPLLDRLYLQVLDYFVYDGLMDAVFTDPAHKLSVRSQHLNAYLLPALKEFMKDAGRMKVHLPEGFHLGMF